MRKKPHFSLPASPPPLRLCVPSPFLSAPHVNVPGFLFTVGGAPPPACTALAYEEGFLLVTTRSSHRILLLPAVSLKSSPPFISALLPPPPASPPFFFFISPYRFCRSSFQLSPLSSQQLPGDSFSAQIFAFHEYAIIKHPA